MSNSENNTFLITESGYYPLQGFDKIIFVKIVQILMFTLGFINIVISHCYVIRTIFSKEILQTTANVLICVWFIVDIVNAFHFTIYSSFVLIQGQIWLTDTSARIFAFVNMMLQNLQYVTALLVSMEKLVYCTAPFRHYRLFTKKKTSVYHAVLFLFTLLVIMLKNIQFPASFISSLLLCYNIMDDYFYDTSSQGLVITSVHVYQSVCIVCILLCQIGIFIIAIKKRKKLTRHNIFPRETEKRIWKRTFIAAFSLFAVIFTHAVGWLWVACSIKWHDRIHATIQRFGVVFLVFATPMVNPIAILLGNKPLREEIMKKNKPAWLFDSSTSRRESYQHSRVDETVL